MKTRNILRNLLLVSIFLTWFFGIGSWGDFFGFMSYGLIPADKPAVSSPISSEPEDLRQRKMAKHQTRQQQQVSNAVDASDRIHIENDTKLTNGID